MRYFRFLVAGHAVSAYGVFLNLIALNLFAYETTGSALQTGLLMALRLFAGVAGGALMGSLSHRFDLKRVLVVAELTQGTALLSLAVLQNTAGNALLYGVVCVAGLCSTSSTVALRTAIPAMVGADQRVWANGLLASCRSVAMVAGFASAGVVVSLLGYTAAFVLVAGTFLLAALNLAWLPLRTRTGDEEDEGEGEGAPPGRGSARGAGRVSGWLGRWALLGFLRLYPLVLMLLMVRAVDGFGSSAHNVGLPIQSRALDPAHPAVFISQFWATWAVGNILAQRLVTRYAKRHGAPSERAFAVGVMVMSAAFILAFTGLPLWLAIPVMLLAGAADGFTENTYVSRLQALPEKRRGAVFGLCVTVENTSFGVGMLVSAALMERYTPLTVVGVMHGAALVCGLALLLTHRRLATATGHAGGAEAAAQGPGAALPGARTATSGRPEAARTDDGVTS
ncbi:MFS transporter [Streptomyces sp. JJ38]|uniref:MFS transporter n=1 Tax=Streptomyces sp. JJ38 TaxID=2738128 RepID=UPI001C5960F2|nr:MFS transporter [Streptomyces sp. JJ38]MBW1599927.1 MFS transporter [Streptomyces sp. JJ38]